jgi:two-component system cell cycle sensor histidine kinase/response regulator CckA
MPYPSQTERGFEILVVDDDTDVREIMAEYLVSRGYIVHQAGDGAEALQVLDDNPSLRVIVSDVRMPRVSGLVLAKMVAERHPEVRVILVSGYFQSQTLGPRFLKKPFTMQQLERMVQDELTTATPS